MDTVTLRYIGYRPETGCFTCAVFNGNNGECLEAFTEDKLKRKVEATLKKITKGRKMVLLNQNKGAREITYKF